MYLFPAVLAGVKLKGISSLEKEMGLSAVSPVPKKGNQPTGRLYILA